jgi:RNA ligase (TIGR02306 family)
MTDFHVEVVKLGELIEHPNAERLLITQVKGFQVITGKDNNFKLGDLVVYLPIDSIVPANDPQFEFLKGHNRIRASRLRGLFSCGLIIPAKEGWVEGQEVDKELGITKYVHPSELEDGVSSQNDPDPGSMPVYDIEGLRRWKDILVAGEEVFIAEKLEGENARYHHDGTRLWVGSRTRFKKDIEGNKWWIAAKKMELEQKLSSMPHLAFYGELLGHVKKFPYGMSPKEIATLRFFDVLEVKTRRWLDIDEQLKVCEDLKLPVAPALYRGPFNYDEAIKMSSGKSTLDNHFREGIVVRPVKERVDQALGRVILKDHGEEWLLYRSKS